MNDKFEYAILYYGNILDPQETWKTLKVPMTAIKCLLPTSGNWKIEVIWNEGEEYNIDMFNKIEFE